MKPHTLAGKHQPQQLRRPLFNTGWVQFELPNVTNFVYPLPGNMKGDVRMRNLLWRLQSVEEISVESLMDATGFFNGNDLNQRGQEFQSWLLPAFHVVSSALEQEGLISENMMSVWHEFKESLLFSMAVVPWTPTD